MDTNVNWLRIARLTPTLTKGLIRAAQGKPVAFSFNISDRCPINCDCYWRAQSRVPELTDDQVVSFFNTLRQQGYVHATLIGGEPYVRPALLERVTPIMPTNWLVTSGTTPLRQLPNTTHVVSVDGANAETHNTVRHSEGLFERILKHLEKARAMGNFPVIIHTVLNSMNYEQIGDILKFWQQNGLADGVTFSTATPIKNAVKDKHLRLTREQRAEIVTELFRQKVAFGDYMVMSQAMIATLHPTITAKHTPKNCGTSRFVTSLDAGGNAIKQCILSEQANCSECGCVITTMTNTFIRFNPLPDFGTLKVLAKMTTI